MQNKINQSNGIRAAARVGGCDIRIYHDTMSNKFYSNYTLSFALVFFRAEGLRKTPPQEEKKLLPSFLSPDIAYISSAHLSCHRLIHTHISAFEVIKTKIFILGFRFFLYHIKFMHGNVE